MTRGDSRTELPLHTPAAGSTHQRQTWPLSEPVAMAERSSEVTRICLIECFGGVAAACQRKCVRERSDMAGGSLSAGAARTPSGHRDEE